ncbi:hypothetical protein niasHT_024866 [Heterodera trifolii]|uniref:Ubiquitin-like domain-containing protein n=1 Tax=Heterodera trifolii TaxID=157864 RepID=A0ABD2JGA2_9BILA
MSHFGFSLLPVGISVGIIALLLLMIPSSTDGIKITVRSDKDIPKKASILPTKKKMRAKDERTMIIVDLNSEKTVTALKKAIEKETGIPCEHQLIRHNSSSGEVLKDEETLENNGLEKADVFMSFGELEILVKYGKETFTTRVDKSETVATLKKAIKQRFGILPKEQTLRFNNTFGLALEDEQTMEEYGIKDGQTILLSLGEFQIVVRYGMKRHSVNVKGTDTVATLKERIENIKKFGNIPPKQQILKEGIYGNRVYYDDQTMYKCHITQDETIEVSWRKFEILVKHDETEEPFTVEVEHNDSVKDLKDKIKEKIGIQPEKQTLINSYQDKFSDDMRLCDRFIAKGETIFVSDAFQITVNYRIISNKYDYEKKVNVDVKGKDTVINVKEKIKAAIEKKLNVKFDDGGRKMELYKSVDKILDKYNKTMDQYGIKKGDEIRGKALSGWKNIEDPSRNDD